MLRLDLLEDARELGANSEIRRGGSGFVAEAMKAEGNSGLEARCYVPGNVLAVARVVSLESRGGNPARPALETVAKCST